MMSSVTVGCGLRHDGLQPVLRAGRGFLALDCRVKIAQSALHLRFGIGRMATIVIDVAHVRHFQQASRQCTGDFG